MVFAGKLGTLLAVKDMLSESVPVVLVAESGGVADFIRFGVEFLKETGEPQKVLKFRGLETRLCSLSPTLEKNRLFLKP